MAINRQKIAEHRKRSLPITLSSLSVTTAGNLEERKNQIRERIISGYGVIWGSINEHKERFVKGAFAKSIKDLGPGTTSAYKIKFTDRHGKSCALFAELIEDEIGLFFRTSPLDKVSWADDLLVQFESGTLNNFSIRFRHMWDKVEWDEENNCLVIIEARLYEIAGVDIPSDMETYALRSQEEVEYLNEDVEDFIESLPRSKHLDARKIFARCLALANSIEPQTIIDALKAEKKPQEERGIDLNYLTKNFKL